MLSLSSDCSNCQEHKAPKYIQLSLGHNAIGRGYKSNVKLLHYPWLSRKHLTITKVDSPHFLEAYGKTGVFVNGRKVSFKVLHEGDCITIGGGGSELPVDSRLPSEPGPFIEYIYSYNTKIEDRENIYKDPVCNPDYLIPYEEVINGRIVNETYHLQDFETTFDGSSSEVQSTVLPVESLSPADEKMPCKRPVRNRKPRKDLDMVYNDPKPNKRFARSSSLNSVTDNSDIPGSSIKDVDESSNASISTTSLSSITTSSSEKNVTKFFDANSNISSSKSSLSIASNGSSINLLKCSSDVAITSKSNNAMQGNIDVSNMVKKKKVPTATLR